MRDIVQEIRSELTKLKSISADQARTMPPTYYTSPEFLALEEEHIDYVKLCHEFNEEDKEKLETLQKGLKTRYLKPSYLAPADFEGTIWDMYQFMARRLGSDVELG